MIKYVGTWVQRFFARKWPEISKKVGIFPKMGVSPNKGFSL